MWSSSAVGSGISRARLGHRLQQVGARYDADELVTSHHGQALDVVGLHRIDDLFQRRIFGDCDRLAAS